MAINPALNGPLETIPATKPLITTMHIGQQTYPPKTCSPPKNQPTTLTYLNPEGNININMPFYNK